MVNFLLYLNFNKPFSSILKCLSVCIAFAGMLCSKQSCMAGGGTGVKAERLYNDEHLLQPVAGGS